MTISTLLGVVIALALVALVAAAVVILGRRLGEGAASAEAGRILREQLGEVARSVAELGRELSQARSEAREEAQKNRTAAAEAQAQNLTVLQARVHETMGLVNQQLAGSTKVLTDLKGQMGGLAETARQMQELGKDIASLQDILRAPKLRGNLGELLLEELLRQVLPTGSYAVQKRLPGKERGSYVTVDATIQLGERLVPIDSKFPLESFQRVLGADGDEARERERRGFVDAVKKHIDQIADKYILPEAGTYDFALMYLPAENIYYEAVIRDAGGAEDKSIVAYAARRKVIPVSPNTMYAYLLTIAYGLKGLQIERQAEAIRSQLAVFQKKFATFFAGFEKVGHNLALAHRHYDEAAGKAEKLNDAMGVITGVAVELGSDGGSAAPIVELQPVLPLGAGSGKV